MPKRESSSEPDNTIDALRMSAHEQASLIARLDARAGRFEGDNRREGSRLSYQVPRGLTVEVSHPGGTATTYLVRPRDLSSKGMSFLHGTFIYADSPCRLVMTTLDGRSVAITGRVRRCQHVSGRAHEIGVEFDRSVRLQDFLQLQSTSDGAVESEGEPWAGGDLATSDLPCLSGNVLYIDDSIVDRELLRFHLRNQRVNLTVAANVAEGAAQMKKQRFAVVMVDIDQTGGDTAAVLESIGQAGHEGSIIVVTADEAHEQLPALARRPGVQVLIKPYPVEQLIRTMAAASRPAGDLPPLFSAYWTNTQMRPLITTFVHDMTGKLRQLESHAAANDWAAVQRMSLELKGAAGGCGYGRIQQAAAQLHQLSRSHDDLTALHGKIRELIELATQARQSIDTRG